VLGHRVAGLERIPPISGLGNMTLSTYTINLKNRRIAHAIVEPMLHIKGTKAKASPTLEASVILIEI
jgi:hypothetical protein